MTANYTYTHDQVYIYGYQRRHRKTDWSGIGPGDAFNNNLDYFSRLQGQRLFYQLVRRVQKIVAARAGVNVEAGFEPMVKPQLSPCYTGYPSTLAAYAAVGLTGYLEFEAQVSARLLFGRLRQYLENPVEHDRVRVQPEIYERMARIVCGIVQNRLLLEDLSRAPGAFSIETYRLFAAASMNTMMSVPDILRAVILYGDVLTDGFQAALHPLTQALHRDIAAASAPFLARLSTTETPQLVRLGEKWVRAVCYSLAPYLPDRENEEVNTRPRKSTKGEQGDNYQVQEETTPREGKDIPPLNGLHAPSLYDPDDFKDFIRALVYQNEKFMKVIQEPEVEKVFEFIKTMEQVGGQTRNWEDLRSDLVELALSSGFREGPIQGMHVAGHEVSLNLGDRKKGIGEIYDQPVELSDDLEGHAELLQEAQPITEALRRNLYPNVKQVAQTQRFRSSGALNPGRLPLAEFSTAVFQRYRIVDIADPRGYPVVAIACDGSASLSDDQMHMVKVLAASWLEATVGSGIQVLAALYHSGRVRPGISGPLVQWLYHPGKTPALSRREATRALASLPDEGTGAQADALSLAFILEEARKLARGRMIYLILISDCAWNQSFRTQLSGQEEVQAFFQQAYGDLPGKLHTTLVDLGGARETGFEKLVDKVIPVSPEEIVDYLAVAGRIGTYVSSCLKERQHWLARR